MVPLTILIYALGIAAGARAHAASQVLFLSNASVGTDLGCLSKLHYNVEEDDARYPAPEGMRLYPLHVSGSWEDRVDLTFFADGCRPPLKQLMQTHG